jgi:hypothetical protein
MVGVAAMGQKYGENSGVLGALSIDGTKVFGFTADVSAKFGGFSLFGAYVYQTYQLGDAFGANADDYDPWGFVVQAGYSLNDEWELFARYEEGNANGANNAAIPAPGGGTILDWGNPSIITIGANYFINDNVKFTVDWGMNFAENMSIFAGSSSDTGWTASDESDQWVLRAQLQLLF